MRAWIVLGLLCLGGVARADEDGWLTALRSDVEADWKAGKPLVIQAHVPLCSNEIIRCGGHGLGDGDNPGKNLYWSTSGGFKGWFGRKESGWELVRVARADGDVLETRVWKRTVAKGRDVYVVASAWRGTAIDATVTAYIDDLYGTTARTVTLDDGTTIEAGGAARVVAWVGHNRWMDIDTPDWDAIAKKQGATRKGTIALACKTADYLGAEVSDEKRVPLLMTTDFLFAGAHAFEGAVWAFATGGSLADIRDATAASYAEGQKKPKKRVKGAFTNPSDKRWTRWTTR